MIRFTIEVEEDENPAETLSDLEEVIGKRNLSLFDADWEEDD